MRGGCKRKRGRISPAVAEMYSAVDEGWLQEEERKDRWLQEEERKDISSGGGDVGSSG